MQLRQLGSSALRVSEIALGSWLTYGVGVGVGVERERGIACVHHAPDSPPPANTRAVSDKMGGFMSDLMRGPVLRAVQQLQPLAEQAGTSMSRFALAWILREPNVASAIVGASSKQQLDDTAAASGLKIDPELFAAADAALAKVARF